MEEKSKNTGLIAALVIFIIISLGLGGFIVYDKLINNDADCAKNLENETNKKNTTTEEQTTTEKDTYQVLALSPIKGHAVLYKGEVYVNVYDSTLNIDNVYGEGKFQILLKARNNYQEYSFENLTVSVDNTNKWLKLNATNIKSIHNNEYGQALSSINPKYGIVLLDSDNTVYYVSIKNLIEGNINLTKLEVTDISTVVIEEKGGMTTYLVKSDGTKINVNTLIK